MKEVLDQLQTISALRELKVHEPLVDFSSNDYLSISRNPKFKDLVIVEIKALGQMGATGSRLLTGNNNYVEEFEQSLAQLTGFEAALVMPSGYQANAALISALATRGNTIIRDELCHASIIDGTRMGLANALKFKHNNVSDLERKLDRATGDVYVIIEALYSMDGDLAPIAEIQAACAKWGAHLIVDEAHSFGTHGERGLGQVHALGLSQKVFAVVLGFGKAAGFQGGAVLCSTEAQQFLINKSRPFIFSTGNSPVLVAGMKAAVSCILEAHNERKELKSLIAYFQKKCEENSFSSSPSQIQEFRIPGNEEVVAKSEELKSKGYLAMPIRKPTVPEGQERIRICLHSFNTTAQIDELFETVMS